MEEDYSGEAFKSQPKIPLYKDDPGVDDPNRNRFSPVIDGNPTPGLYRDSPDVGAIYRAPNFQINSIKQAAERARNPRREYHLSLFHPKDIIELEHEGQKLSLLVTKAGQRHGAGAQDFASPEFQIMQGSDMPPIPADYLDPSYPAIIEGSLISASNSRLRCIVLGDSLHLQIRPSDKPPLDITTFPITKMRVKRLQEDTYREVPLSLLAKHELNEQNENFRTINRIYSHLTDMVQKEIDEKLPTLHQDSYYKSNRRLRVWNNGNVITFFVNEAKKEPYMPIKIYDRNNLTKYTIEKREGAYEGEEIFEVNAYEGVTAWDGEFGADPPTYARQSYTYLLTNVANNNMMVEYRMTKAQLQTLDLFQTYDLPTTYRIDAQGTIHEVGKHHPENEEQEAKLAQIKTRIEKGRFFLNYGENENAIPFPPNLSDLETIVISLQ